MCRFVESIKLKDGVFYRLPLHQQRVNKAFEAFYPGCKPVDVVEALLQTAFPQEGVCKCRLVYDSDLQSLDIVPYVRREIRSLKLVETTQESLPYKREDRTEFNAAFAQRGGCDDVLLVKDGFLTDTSYCDIALYDGEKWYTPRTPLLYGVNRMQLLSEAKLIERDISVSELMNFQYISLFNALIEFGELQFDVFPNIRSVY